MIAGILVGFIAGACVGAYVGLKLWSRDLQREIAENAIVIQRNRVIIADIERKRGERREIVQ